MPYLFGAGGHAKVIIEILEEMRVEIEGLFDENTAVKDIYGYPVTRYSEVEEGLLIIAIGNNHTRKKIVSQIRAKYAKAIHPKTIISKRALIAEGTVVMAGATLNADTNIGRHCIINTNASIDHDCRIGDFAHISPNATLCGNVQVGEGAHIGAGAVLIPGVKIGKWAVIGAGSVVIRDVADEETVVGTPARTIQKVNNQL